MKLNRHILATWLGLIPLAASGQVVINEILYHAPDDLDELQFVELHNAGSQPVDLSNWSFTKGIKHTFASGTTIPAQGFLVLARNADLFRTHYGRAADGVFASRINPKGERLELVDAQRKRVDSVKFSDKAPWPTGPDGHSGSLERIVSGANGDDPANWISSPLSPTREKPTGTPGQPNAGHAAAVPPVVEALTFSPELPEPGQPIRVEAVVRAGDAPNAVTLRFRLAGSGVEKPDTVLPMQSSAPGRYLATIPGQEAGQIVRFRVEAMGARGARRLFPAETEPRPAFSAYVLGKVETGQIPVGWIIHTNEKERNAAASQQNASPFPFAFPPPDPDGPAREQVMRFVEEQLDLSTLWFELGTQEGLEPAKWSERRAWILEKVDQRLKWVQAANPGPGLVDRLPKVMETLAQFADQTVADLKTKFGTDGEKAGAAWLAWRKERNLPGGKMITSRADLEGAWYAITLNAQTTLEVLKPAIEAVRALRSQREPLIADVAAGRGADTAFREQRNQADDLRGAIATKLKPLVDRTSGGELERWAQEPRAVVLGFRNPAEEPAPRGFGGPRPGRGGPGGPGGGPFNPFGGTPSEPGTFTSAFAYHDPATHRTQFFDFVQVTPRKGGRKVHFHRDQPLEGMTTVAIVFEEDTGTLVEPLAFDVYRRAGMASEKCFHVRLWQDGKLLGYSLLTEQPNRAFLRSNQIRDDGNLYKLLWFGEGIAGQHEKHSHRHEGHEDIVGVVNGLNQVSGAAQWEFIQKNFDVDQVAGYFAVNSLLSHWDGFFNNYFAYHDTHGTGKWTLYPWDQDSTWGLRAMGAEGEVFYNMPLSFGMNGANPTGDGGWWRPPGWFSGPLLANPSFRQVFLKRVKHLCESVYNEAVFEPVLKRLEQQLTPEVRLRAEVNRENPDQAVERLKDGLRRCRLHLQKRREFLLAQAELKQVTTP